MDIGHVLGVVVAAVATVALVLLFLPVVIETAAGIWRAWRDAMSDALGEWKR